MREMPELETDSLRIRPFTLADIPAAHAHAVSIGWVNQNLDAAAQLAAMGEYINWCSINHLQLARLDQPPFGDRAVVLRDTGELIGSCGLVPVVDTLAVFPYF